jgi:hypothetical protein
MWATHRLTDSREIQAFLETDRLHAAYALGDLEPGLFEDCTVKAKIKLPKMANLEFPSSNVLLLG